MQNQVLQILIGMSQMMYHKKALSTVIRTTFEKSFEKVFSVMRKTSLKLLV